MYGHDNHRAIRNIGENRRHRNKNHRAIGYGDEELGALRYSEARYTKKKQQAITW